MTEKANYSEVVNIARDYYNSEDADNFYSIIWGGEDIHVGLYDSLEDQITDASHRTVQHMAQKINLTPEHHVLDIGSGYGGAARYLAKTFGCSVTALNLSEKENQRARELNAQQGLADKINVVDGSFENIPAEHNSFDLIWSQDAILHSGNKDKVIQEVSRVLKPGGHFIFTDPMQADDCPDGVIEPVLKRIHLDSLGSFALYRKLTQEAGLKEVEIEDLTHQLVNHYTRVRQELSTRREELEGKVSSEYIDRMIQGLGHWVDAGDSGYLSWGVMLFQKPA
jgi:sarcosine/dimethylglycine N-methyltransferase